MRSLSMIIAKRIKEYDQNIKCTVFLIRSYPCASWAELYAPWTTSLVIPLHKKGCIYDLDNFRAIAVASNMGKTFASILLQRLIAVRSLTDPDTDNQLGFCKDAQSSDHIFTLTTCVDKYVQKAKSRLYSCFVDYAKAFDSVCREALLFKLW